MPRSTIILLATFALTACSSFYSSSPEEKLAAYSIHRGSWNEDSSPKDFGLSRSVQVIQGSKVKIGKNCLAYDGGLGMASLITKDGYALTAAHVISNPPLDSFLALPNSVTSPGPTIHVHRQTFTFKVDGDSSRPAKVSFPNKLVAFSPDLDDPTALPVGSIAVRSLRIVKSFPERDIALVKLPLHTSVAFDLRRKPLGSDTVLFASGNWATPYRGTSAGTVTSVNTAHPTATVIRTTAPLAKGDSGGPVFDGDGRLVGIASRVIPAQLLPYPNLRHSSLRTLDSDTVEALIAADRRAHQ